MGQNDTTPSSDVDSAVVNTASEQLSKLFIDPISEATARHRKNLLYLAAIASLLSISGKENGIQFLGINVNSLYFDILSYGIFFILLFFVLLYVLALYGDLKRKQFDEHPFFSHVLGMLSLTNKTAILQTEVLKSVASRSKDAMDVIKSDLVRVENDLGKILINSLPLGPKELRNISRQFKKTSEKIGDSLSIFSHELVGNAISLSEMSVLLQKLVADLGKPASDASKIHRIRLYLDHSSPPVIGVAAAFLILSRLLGII